jgi:von Willebrand factor type A domain
MRVSPFLLALLLVSGAGVHAQKKEESGIVETTRIRLLTVRFRVAPKAEAPRDACAKLTRADLSVRVRGKPVEPSAIVSLARDERPMLHAFLIDRSGSMVDKLDLTRRAVHAYIKRLRPGLDRGMVVFFDEDVVLAAPETGDLQVLDRAVDSVVLGSTTAIFDALYATVGELSSQLERPVVLLLSDGVDTASIVTQDDVTELTARRPDLAIFPIGVNLPEISPRGPGPITPKKFLDNLARHTDGEFLDVPTAGGLASAYDRVRDLLDSEWEVVVADPDPDLDPEDPKVRITGKPCSIRILGQGGDEPRESKKEPEERDVAPPNPRCEASIHWIPRKSARLGPRIGAAFAAETTTRGIRGCVVDLTADDGSLYDSQAVEAAWFNDWREFGSRPFEIHAPAIADLPTRPESALDAVARELMKHTGPVPDPGPRQIPIESHARPFKDLPFIWNGRTAFAARSELALALGEIEEYAAYTRARTQKEVNRLLDDEATRIARTSKGMARERMRDALAASPEGQALLARAENPGPREFERHLAAWIGDVPAADVFRDWELQAIAHALDGRPDTEPPFDEAYQAAYRLFFVPSYARILAPLVMGKDPKSGAIGLWRFVLPRTVWIRARKRDFDDPEFRRVPMDLVPDRPLGLWLARKIAEETRGKGLAPQQLTYEPLVKPKKFDPDRAFTDVRVSLYLVDRKGRDLLITADLARGDDHSEPIVRAAEVQSPSLKEIAQAITGTLSVSAPNGAGN